MLPPPSLSKIMVFLLAVIFSFTMLAIALLHFRFPLH